MGAVLGSAVGDALGAGYEFESAPLGSEGPRMIGGGLGGFAPGEWTDDTSMAWCVLEVAASGADLRTDEALNAIARHFRDWYETGPADIGTQTASVLARAGSRPTAAAMTAVSDRLHASTGRTAGNGSLMRTHPVALAHLDDAAAAAEAAWKVGTLTHGDPVAGEACVLWTLAVRHAIVEGEFDLHDGLAYLTPEAAGRWAALIDEAEREQPGRFTPNGFVVTALQAAWSAIVHTPVDPQRSERHLGDALTTAIRIGNDTDTVAAIAGALLGARWGTSALQGGWLDLLHGYPGLRADDLAALAERAVDATG